MSPEVIPSEKKTPEYRSRRAMDSSNAPARTGCWHLPPGARHPLAARRPLVGGAALVIFLLVGASCALFQSEESLGPTPTIASALPTTTPAPLATAETMPPETSAATPETTSTTDPAPATTTSPTRIPLDYLDRLLATEADIADLVANVQVINDNWDDRSRTGVSFAETEAALEITAERARELEESFGLIAAPSELGLWDEHRIAGSSVGIMSAAPQEMLDGLRSPDAGHARRAALVGFLTAFDLYKQVADRVAAIIGEDGLALLETRRSQVTVSVTTLPEPTTTLAEPATTVVEPTTTITGEAPPNPGNSKNCSDFATQAESQEWFDTYYPFYGDVAKLDTNNNGTACELLP